MKYSIWILFLIGMVGCATSPVPLTKSEPGTYNPALSSSLRTQTPQTGTLVVIRDSGMLGGMCKEVVSVDAQEIGYVHTSQELTVYLTPGQHEVYVEIGEHSLCATGRTSAIFSINVGQTIVMDIHLSQGEITITPQNLGNTSTAY